MDNARISIAVPMILVHVLVLVTNQITKEALESLTNYPDIIRWSTTIFRLNDDLGTSSVMPFSRIKLNLYFILRRKKTQVSVSYYE